MSEIIGGIAVEITGDFSKLNAAIGSSVNTAQAGGEKIAAALSAGAAPASQLTAAIDRLAAANMAFAQQSTRALQAVQSSAPGYQAAQNSIAKLNQELRDASAEVLRLSVSTNESAATNATAAATSIELAAATKASAAAFSAQASAAATAAAAVTSTQTAMAAAATSGVSVGTAATTPSAPIGTPVASSSVTSVLAAQTAAQSALTAATAAGTAQTLTGAQAQRVLANSTTGTTGTFGQAIGATQASTATLGTNANATLKTVAAQNTAGTATLGFNKALGQQAALAGTATGSVNAYTAATTKAAAASNAHAVSGQQAASAFIRVGEGANAIRAVETFLSKTLNLGPALQAIFPIVGAIAFTEILVKMGVHLYEFYENASNAGERISGAFRGLSNEINTTNSELLVGNDRLEQELAKITGTPHNGIKLAIDQALQAADQLASKLDSVLKKLGDIVKEEERTGFKGSIEAFFAGEAPTPKAIGSEALRGKTGMGGATKEIADIQENAREQIKAQSEIAASTSDTAKQKAALDEANKIRTKTLIELEAKYGEEIGKRATATEAAARAQAAREIEQKRAADPFRDPRVPVPIPTSNQRNVELGSGEISTLRKQLEQARLEFKKVSLEQKVDFARDAKDASNEAKKAADEWLTAQREVITKLKEGIDPVEAITAQALKAPGQSIKSAQASATTLQKQYPGEVTPAFEEKLYRDRIVAAEAGGKAFEQVVIKLEGDIARARQAAIRSRQSTEKSEIERTKREFEEQLREVQESEEFGNSQTPTPKAAGLQFVEKTLAKPEVSQGELEGAKSARPKLLRETAAESEHIISKMLKDSDEAFAEEGAHTAAQMSEYYGKVIAFLQAVGEDEDRINETRKRKRVADKAAEQESLKLTGAGAQGQAAIDQSNIATARSQAQYNFESKIATTLQEQLQQKQQMAVFDALELESKRDLAQKEVELAVASGNVDRIEQASKDYLLADLAVRNQRIEAEQKLALAARNGTVAYQVQVGLMKSIEGTADSMAAAFAHAVVEGKGIGRVWRDSLKELETAALGTVTKAMTDSILNAAKGALSSITGAIGGQIGGILGKIGLAGTTQTPQLTATTANTSSINLLTSSNQALLAALQGNTIVTTGNTTSTAVNSTSTNANTVAVHASTAATIAKSIKDTIVGAAKTAGGLVTGAKAAKEVVTSTVSFGAEAADAAAKTANTAAIVANTAVQGTLAAEQGVIATETAGVAIDLGANTAAVLALTAAVIDLTVTTAINSFLPFAGGGRPPVGVPSLVGEKGMELFVPDEAGTIIPADKTSDLLAGKFKAPEIPAPPKGQQVDAPEAPGTGFASGYQSASGTAASGSSMNVNNHNTGRVGDTHINIYGANNPRETMRQIADFEKRQTGKYSPMNS